VCCQIELDVTDDMQRYVEHLSSIVKRVADMELKVAAWPEENPVSATQRTQILAKLETLKEKVKKLEIQLETTTHKYSSTAGSGMRETSGEGAAAWAKPSGGGAEAWAEHSGGGAADWAECCGGGAVAWAEPSRGGSAAWAEPSTGGAVAWAEPIGEGAAAWAEPGIGHTRAALRVPQEINEKMQIYEDVMTVLNREIEKLAIQADTSENLQKADRELFDVMDKKIKSLERQMAMKDATIAELELRITSLELKQYVEELLPSTFHHSTRIRLDTRCVQESI